MTCHRFIRYHQHDRVVLYNIHVFHNALEVFGLDPKGLACWNVSNAPYPTIASSKVLSDVYKL